MSLNLAYKNETCLVETPPSYSDLLQAIKKNFGADLPARFHVNYENSKGDHIVLSGNNDYETMIKTELDQSITSVKIFIAEAAQEPNVEESKSEELGEREKNGKECEDVKTTAVGRRNFRKIRKEIKEFLIFAKLCKLNPSELYKKKIFSTEPYEKENSKEFIHAGELGDLTRIKQLLLENKYLAFDFDDAHQTALHWAAKQGNVQVANLLIDSGVDVNAKDLSGRTPLYFAIHFNHIEMMKLLLRVKCDPWSTEKVNYSEMVRKKPLVKHYLSKGRQIHITMSMTPVRDRDEVWTQQSVWLKPDFINLPTIVADSNEDIGDVKKSTTYHS